MNARLVPATPHHARLIAPLMRPRDITEVRAQCSLEPVEAMNAALAASPGYARTLFLDLMPLALFGVAPLSVLGGSSHVWCFGTRHIDAHRFTFARLSRRILPQLFNHARLLTNYVDTEDHDALRWLTFLGATHLLHPQLRGGRLFGQFVLASEPKGIKTCLQG